MHAFFSKKVEFVLTFFCLIVGTVGIFKDGLQYLLLAFIIPAIILLVVLSRRYRNIPIPTGQNLGIDQADQLIYEAVEISQYPICAHLSTSHCTGVAIAALAARTILRNIEHLQDMIIERQIQMQDETDFTPDVVERHIQRLRRIQAIITGLLSKSNILVFCYNKINGSNLVIESLHKIRRNLDQDIIEKLEEFYKCIPKKVGRHMVDVRWGPLIKNRITVEAPRLLAKIGRSIVDIQEPARAILKKLESDWGRDIIYLHKDSLCTPPNHRIITVGM